MSKLHKNQASKDTAMKALIIYQDFASAAKANAALQHSAHLPDIRVKWHIRPWRMEMLKFPPTAEEALADAMDAHLLLFTGSCAQSIPFWLQDWLSSWAKQRQIAGAALAVIGDEKKKAFTPSANPDLSQYAALHGLSIIFDNRNLVVTGSPFLIGKLSESNLGVSLVAQANHKASRTSRAN